MTLAIFMMLAALSATTVPPLQASDHILAVDADVSNPKRPSGPVHPGKWQATAADAFSAKRALFKWLDADQRPPLLMGRWFAGRISPLDYELQYVGHRLDPKTGHFETNGTKIVIIHGVLKKSRFAGDDLDRHELLISDGGREFFEAYFDVDRKKLLMFAFHSPG